MEFNLPVSVKGHLNIKDDLGETLVDKNNAIHPQNMSRIIARALSNENNYFVNRIAFGNKGTEIDASFQLEYKTPNDGQLPDPRTWDSRLYNETYSEIIDESNVLIGTDPGSAGPNVGQRPGGGADPSGDPTSVEHVSGPGVRSNELGLTSEVVITAVLNPGEPTGQFGTDQQAPTENPDSDFTFDEIGLFTSGGPGIASAGYQSVDVGNRTSEDDTGLAVSTQYSFTVTVDGGTPQIITFTTPAGGGSGPSAEILYGDLAEAINTGDVAWGMAGVPVMSGASATITDYSGVFPTIIGAQTYGAVRFDSNTTGVGSSILVTDGGGPGIDLFTNINPPTGGVIQAAQDGVAAGIQNDPVNFSSERERMLTHIIFSPVLKSANRTLTITYTLTVSVARTV